MLNHIYSNNVNGVGTENSESLGSDRGPVCKQADLCRQSDTASPEQNNQNSTTTIKRKNRKRSKEEIMFIMECYFRSNPSRLGYRKRVLEPRNSKGFLFITEQQLVDQANNICKRGWLTEIELEKIEKKIALDTGNKNDTNPVKITPQETNTTEEEPSIEQVDQTPNANQDVWYTIKEPFNEEEENPFERLVTLTGSIARNEIPRMKNVDKKYLSEASTKVDAMFKKIAPNNITTLRYKFLRKLIFAHHEYIYFARINFCAQSVFIHFGRANFRVSKDFQSQFFQGKHIFACIYSVCQLLIDLLH